MNSENLINCVHNKFTLGVCVCSFIKYLCNSWYFEVIVKMIDRERPPSEALKGKAARMMPVRARRLWEPFEQR